MLAPVRTVAPTALITWEEADRQLRLSGDETEKAFVESLIAAATGYLDGYSGILGRALVTQSWRQDLSSFCDYLRLPLAPVQSITSVTYFDADNATQTLSTDVYALFTDATGPYVALKPSQSWPSVYSRREAISVTFVAGYGTPADVPAPIKQAALMLVAHWFEQREAVAVGVSAVEMPLAVHHLIAPYRRIHI